MPIEYLNQLCRFYKKNCLLNESCLLTQICREKSASLNSAVPKAYNQQNNFEKAKKIDIDFYFHLIRRAIIIANSFVLQSVQAQTSQRIENIHELTREEIKSQLTRFKFCISIQQATLAFFDCFQITLMLFCLCQFAQQSKLGIKISRLHAFLKLVQWNSFFNLSDIFVFCNPLI